MRIPSKIDVIFEKKTHPGYTQDLNTISFIKIKYDLYNKKTGKPIFRSAKEKV